MQHIEFQEGLEKIGSYAFQCAGCDGQVMESRWRQTNGIESLTIPKSVKVIAGCAFLDAKVRYIDVLGDVTCKGGDALSVLQYSFADRDKKPFKDGKITFHGNVKGDGIPFNKNRGQENIYVVFEKNWDLSDTVKNLEDLKEVKEWYAQYGLKVIVKGNIIAKDGSKISGKTFAMNDPNSILNKKKPTAPSATTISTVTNQKGKKLAVKWKKNAKGTGYQVQISTDKSFKSGNKSKTIRKNTTVSATFTGLKKNKTYYVRVRVTGKNSTYSKWSAVKSVKVKK